MRKLVYLAAACLAAAAAHGQVLRLSEQRTGVVDIEAQTGDTLHLAITADLGRYSAAGLSLFVKVPTEGFDILGATTPAGPFQPGPLFDGAMVLRNQVMSPTDAPDTDPTWRLLEYSAVLGPSGGRPRARTGSGQVALFRIYCRTVATAQIRLHSSPVHESRLLLDDGRTERPFLNTPPLLITVDHSTAVGISGWGVVKRLAR